MPARAIGNECASGSPGLAGLVRPNALDGSVTWCAQREPTIHAYSYEDLGKDMALADAELAAGAAR